MKNSLAVPLSISQIEAANRLHGQLLQWQLTDRTLHALHASLPGFAIEATLLKVVAVNQLYGTNVYAVIKMAQHITEVMQDTSGMDDIKLVEKLASLDGRRHLSFASKFAHFFIDEERFPIYDSYAVKMLAYHLGKDGQAENAAYPYRAFIENIHRLKDRAQLSCTSRELDHYLWLAGLHRAWSKNREAQINAEVSELFDRLFTENPSELTALASPETTNVALRGMP